MQDIEVRGGREIESYVRLGVNWKGKYSLYFKWFCNLIKSVGFQFEGKVKFFGKLYDLMCILIDYFGCGVKNGLVRGGFRGREIRKDV